MYERRGRLGIQCDDASSSTGLLGNKECSMEVVRPLDRFFGFAATDGVIEGQKKCRTTKDEKDDRAPRDKR